MSDDLREGVARAIYDTSWMYDRTKPWSLAPEREKQVVYIMADAALAEMGKPAPFSVREAARVLLDWTDHNVNGAGQDFADDIGTGGIAALRAIAKGKDDD